jgi:hypothetical protein
VNIYIFPYIDPITENWHSGGGLVIVARDLEQAQALVNANAAERGIGAVALQNEEKEDDNERIEMVTYPLEGKHEARLFVFQDAGCC